MARKADGAESVLRRTTITISNESDRTLSGIRLRFRYAIGILPDYAITGKLLSETEASAYIERIGEKIGESGLPELPPLPPGSDLRLEFFDAFLIEPLLVSAPGAGARVVRVVRTDKASIFGWEVHPDHLIDFLVIMVALFPVATFLFMRGRRSRRPSSE